MKNSRFSEEQIVCALRMADGGTPVLNVCRQTGISEATFYTWKKNYGELGVGELRKPRQLEDENPRLRRIVADLTLDKQILQGVVKKSSEGCQAPRAGSLDAGAFQGHLRTVSLLGTGGIMAGARSTPARAASVPAAPPLGSGAGSSPGGCSD